MDNAATMALLQQIMAQQQQQQLQTQVVPQAPNPMTCVPQPQAPNPFAAAAMAQQQPVVPSVINNAVPTVNGEPESKKRKYNDEENVTKNAWRLGLCHYFYQLGMCKECRDLLYNNKERLTFVTNGGVLHIFLCTKCISSNASVRGMLYAGFNEPKKS